MASKKKAKTKIANTKSGKSSVENYTKPKLREKLKKQVIAGNKGGRAGQWSARKAQLLTHEYEAEGGGYKQSRDPAQKSLKEWGDQKWRTADSTRAIQGGSTHRYLPDSAWKELSVEERKATDRKKVSGSRRGKQYVANTKTAAKARKRATRSKR
jgi:hypothetical protein